MSDIWRKTSPKPHAQLRLIGEEIARELTAVAAKRSSMHTRASILVATSGVLTTVQSSEWFGSWEIISVTLSVLAAVLGLLVLRPVRDLEPNATEEFKTRLRVDEYSAEYSIVKDNAAALKGGIKRVEGMANLLVIGYASLLLSWLAALILSTLSQSNLI